MEAFFDVFTRVVIECNPEKVSEARQARKDLIDINDQIVGVAAELAQLLARREGIKEESHFTCDTFYHVVDAVAAATESEQIHVFDWHVKRGLAALRGQYDLKYWPTLSAIVKAIGENAHEAEVFASDSATDAAT